MALSLDEALGVAALDEGDKSIHIDLATRQVVIPESEKLFGVESDDAVEVKHIVIDGRYTDAGKDISELSWRVNFRNANGDKNVFPVTKVTAGDDSVEFDWIIRRSVVAYKGSIDFVVCAFGKDSDGKLTPEWNSTLGHGDVLEGLEVDVEDIGGDEILDELKSLQVSIKALSDSAEKSASDALDSKNAAAQIETEVGTLGDEKKKAITDESVKQQEAIRKKGSDTLASIPEDYQQLTTDVSQLKEDLVDLTNGVCSIKFDYRYEAVQGEQEPYVFKFYGKSGETYKFENKGIRVLVIIVHTDGTRTKSNAINAGEIFEVTLEKDCKSFGFYPFESGNVLISVYGDSYEKIMSDVLSMLQEPKNRIIENAGNIEKLFTTCYRAKATAEKDTVKTLDNQELVDGGICNYNSKYRIKKYKVDEGDLLFVKSNGRYQFQTDVDIPTSGINPHLIDEQFVGSINNIVRTPQGAKYLMISSLKTSDDGLYGFEYISANFNTSKYYKNDVFISNYDRKWFDGLDLTYDDFNESTTVEQYFSKMNALADSFSWRMTKENLGKDASGNYDIWGYVYSPFDMSSASCKRPRIIITSCHHGFERGSAFELYYLMYLLKNKKSNPIIKELACSAEICFIPIVNPWGWEQYTPVNTDSETKGRKNFNGVDLNRGYNSSTLQPEQIIVKKFVDKYKSNAILFIDHHVNGGSRHSASTMGQQIWLDSDNYECGSITRKINSAFINYWSVNATDLYGGMVDNLLGTQTYTYNTDAGYATYNGDSNGIMSITFETVFKLSKTLEELETEEEFNPNVNKLNTVALVNLIDHYLVSLNNMFMSN